MTDDKIVNRVEAVADTFYHNILKTERIQVKERGTVYALCLVAAAILDVGGSVGVIAQTMLNADYRP